MVSVLAPLAYVGFLFGSLWLFSKLYRKRQQNKPVAEPWFPHHKSRDIYVSLLSLDPPPPRPILIAALLRRAMDDVKLIWSIRDAKTSLTTLLQRGQIGDELWERFLAAEKELEAEIVEVVGEANTFEPGYGQKIFGMASEMVSHERWKEVYEGIAKRREEENAKLASQSPTAPVLSPSSYLTPSSLTLAPSNPLPAAGTTPVPSTSLASPSSPSPSSTTAPLAPLPITSSPPSRDPTPAPDALASPTKSKAAAPPPSEPAMPTSPKPSSSPAVPATPPPAATKKDSTPASTPVQSPTTTPRKTPNKRGKKKPAVKGGR
ncbi:SPOSA6832_01367, partial [Sporobolomyces salmonicolor]